MSKEEFMALTTDEMYSKYEEMANKYKTSDDMWSYTLKQNKELQNEIEKYKDYLRKVLGL